MAGFSKDNTGGAVEQTDTQLAALPPSPSARYRLDALVGQGSMGVVYRAFDTVLHREVALKCIASESSGEALLQAEQEARTLAAIRHPGVLAIHDILVANSQVWLVTEWIRGRNLAALPQPMPVVSWLACLVQIYDALVAIHERGIIHRDIKPSNIMVDDDGRVVLIDFGVAFLAGSSSGHTLAGTFQYLDPLRLEGGAPEVGSDLFSVGLIALELACGQLVLPELAPLPLYHYIIDDLPQRIDEMGEGLFPPVLKVVRGHLVAMLDPETRLPATASSQALAVLHDELSALGSANSASYLRDWFAGGSPALDRALGQLIRRARHHVSSAEVPARERAAWISFVEGLSLPSTSPVGEIISAVSVTDAVSARRRPVGWWFGMGVLTIAGIVAGWQWITQSGRLNPVVPTVVATPVVPVIVVTPVVPAVEVTPQSMVVTVAPVASPVSRVKASEVLLVANMWARVFVDGKMVGMLPSAQPFSLTPGNHVVRLVNPHAEPVEQRIVVPNRTSARFHFSLEPRRVRRTLRMSHPVRVRIAGKDYGIVQSLELDLPLGRHSVQLGEGDKRRTQIIDVRPDGPGVLVLSDKD